MADGERGGDAASRPVGLSAVHEACSAVYTNDQNPLQVTTRRKFWLGGPDPLDYISMFSNHGNIALGIPPHWHYVSLGLSDLHGDGRVHKLSGPGQPSGFGFELTFRVKREDGESAPPTWPVELMQSLSRYVFTSENVLCSGDHISWHRPLDRGDSNIQHILLAPDPQLKRVNSPLGYVDFIQIVGITSEELAAVQKWNGPGILDLLRKYSVTGGQWLITDMRRGESIFDIDISNKLCVDEGVEREGSSLSGVNAVCHWEDSLGRTGSSMDTHQGVTSVPSQAEVLRVEMLDRVNVSLNLEAAKLLPLAVRGRLRHGCHFTFKSFTGDQAVTLVCRGVQGALASEEHPLTCQGPWLQVFIARGFMDVLLHDTEEVLHRPLPRKLEWPDQKLSLSILPNE